MLSLKCRMSHWARIAQSLARAKNETIAFFWRSTLMKTLLPNTMCASCTCGACIRGGRLSRMLVLWTTSATSLSLKPFLPHPSPARTARPRRSRATPPDRQAASTPPSRSASPRAASLNPATLSIAIRAPSAASSRRRTKGAAAPMCPAAARDRSPTRCAGR